eukprot:COSAG06_NODE_542_length_14469_cov_39.223591_9_plen_154_part_00
MYRASDGEAALNLTQRPLAFSNHRVCSPCVRACVHVAMFGIVCVNWSCVLTAQIVAYFRTWSVNDAIEDLSSKVPPDQFHNTFGAGHETLPQLIDAKTVTINRLMELVPEGTPDPTPFVYDRTMYTCVSNKRTHALSGFVRDLAALYAQLPCS